MNYNYWSVITRFSRCSLKILRCMFCRENLNDGQRRTDNNSDKARGGASKNEQDFIYRYTIIRALPTSSTGWRFVVSAGNGNLYLLETLPWTLLARSHAYTQFRLSCKHHVGRCSLEFCESNTRQSAFHRDNASVSRWWQCSFIEAKLLSLLSTKLIAWKLVRAILCACASFKYRYVTRNGR